MFFLMFELVQNIHQSSFYQACQFSRQVLLTLVLVLGSSREAEKAEQNLELALRLMINIGELSSPSYMPMGVR